MQRRHIKPVVASLVLVVTSVAFVHYFATHPQVGRQLRHTSPELLVWLLILYILSIAALAMTTVATLRICQLRVRPTESFLLTAYSAVINFFGPLQSGPAFRAVYLKKKYDLNLKRYAVASLIYLFFWGVYSGCMLLSSWLHWWLSLLVGVAIVAAVSVQRLTVVQRRLTGLELRWWYYLALATAGQIVCVTLIYSSELRTVAPGTTFSQVVVYTGAANLALFVSLTPGAIGFRESFLVFSRHLHHISNNSIVAASLLDRAVYIVLLLLLAAGIFGSHAQRRLQASTNAKLARN